MENLISVKRCKWIKKNGLKLLKSENSEVKGKIVIMSKFRDSSVNNTKLWLKCDET